MNTNTITRDAAIAQARAQIDATRAQVEAVQFPVTAYIVAAKEDAILSLTFDDSGACRFACTNTPRAFARAVAYSHAKRWNAQHGVDHPVHVLAAEDWKAARMATIAEQEKFIADCEAGTI